MSQCQPSADNDIGTQSTQAIAPGRIGKPLTARQREVLQAIALRKSIKEIAREIGVSQSAVNQHIKALKLAYRVNSLGALAQCYRQLGQEGDLKHCRKSTCRDNHLPLEKELVTHSDLEAIQPIVSFSEPLTYENLAPWVFGQPEGNRRDGFPEVLNGQHASWVRTAAIMVVAVSTLLVLMIGLGVAQGLSSALEAHLPASESND